MIETKNEYRIAADANCWTIEKKTVAGKNSKAVAPGTVTWGAIKWYGTLEQAAMGLRELVGRDETAETTLDTSAITEAVSASTQAVKQAIAELKERGDV